MPLVKLTFAASSGCLLLKLETCQRRCWHLNVNCPNGSMTFVRRQLGSEKREAVVRFSEAEKEAFVKKKNVLGFGAPRNFLRAISSHEFDTGHDRILIYVFRNKKFSGMPNTLRNKSDYRKNREFEAKIKPMGLIWSKIKRGDWISRICIASILYISTWKYYNILTWFQRSHLRSILDWVETPTGLIYWEKLLG